MAAEQSNKILQLNFTAVSTQIRKALADVKAHLRPLALDHEETASVEIVLAEVLNNVIEHAYAGAPGPITVRCQHRASGLHFAITDRGVAMPQNTQPIGTSHSFGKVISDLPEGGFGWFLIDGLARDVSYSRETGQNRLTFRIAVALEK